MKTVNQTKERRITTMLSSITFEEACEKYPGIPCSTMLQIFDYVTDGISGGHFLDAVFDNNLFAAFNRADSFNRKALYDIVKFIYSNVPISKIINKNGGLT